MRVIVANEPRAYRDVMAGAVQQLRPHVDVVTVEPQDLDAAVVALEPQVVLCSTVTPVVETLPVTTILLYPNGQNLAVTTVAGKSTTSGAMDFDAVLTVIDQTELLARQTG